MKNILVDSRVYPNLPADHASLPLLRLRYLGSSAWASRLVLVGPRTSQYDKPPSTL
jgi:hypothetical protein